MQHHSPELRDLQERDGYLASFKNMQRDLKKYAAQYQIPLNEPHLANLFSTIDKIWDRADEKIPDAGSFPLFALIKLNFSLLTAADYLATHEYMNSTPNGREGQTFDFGTFDSLERVQQIISHLQQYEHNKQTFSVVDNHIFTYPSERSNHNLNQLRKDMAVELIQTIRKHPLNRLFYIEAPTGGGKTNLSIIAVTELLKANPELTKVYYVFPFTTLITQTFAVLRKSLDLYDNEIIELHSKAELGSRNKENNEDGLFGQEKKDYIDHLFALYPVTLLSHVKFFDILKTNKKETNYLLHRLANSIVIIDEIQSYSPALWDKMLYFINQYAHYFNIRFVVMSATLPKISELNIGLEQKINFVDLIPNARKYITNNNFSKRVRFNFDLYKSKIELEELATAVIDKSKAYANKNGNVRTIIEFIFKKSASEFQRLIAAKTKFFDKILILSGTILESRRKEIINCIKRSAKEPLNILLITTQVVEAGVDIDMDLGFKNTSLIDSDEQLAGRVNRNALKEDCEVYLFHLDDPGILYGGDYRYIKTRESITLEKHKAILEEKNFKQLYEEVFNLVDWHNKLPLKDNLSDYEYKIRKTCFTDIDAGFKIIDQESYTVFVPLQLPMFIPGDTPGKQEPVFSEKAIKFLHKHNVHAVDNHLDGQSVWLLYESLIQNRSSHKVRFDMQKTIELKILQSILSKFCFSLLSHSKDVQKLLNGFGEERYGYLYLSRWSSDTDHGQVYQYETGLNNNALKDTQLL
jgi:CRISPR-associated endonuclease/helicase Cas3